MFIIRRSVSLCTLSLLLFSPCRSTSQSQIPMQVFPNTPLADPVTEKNKHKILDHEFSGYMERVMELWEVKGTTIALVRPDGEVEFGAYGIKTEDGEKITPEAFLASTMGILMDDFQQGKNQTELPSGINSFTWNTKVKDLLPDEWGLLDHWANEKVDILDILSHRSGLPRHDGSYTLQGTALDVIKRMKYLRPAHEPRQKFAYNNQMFTAGSYIIKKYAPTHDYPSFIADRIFSPLVMTSTTFSPEVAWRSGNLSQSWTAHSRRIPFQYRDASVDLISGPGGVITNVVDLSRWLKVLLNKGVDPASNKTVLPRTVYDMVTTAHTLTNGNPAEAQQFSIAGYGMGWLRTSIKGHEILQHAGAIPGFSASVTFFPNDGFGVAILMNTADKATVNQAISLRIAEDVLGLERTPRAEDPTAVYPERPSRDPDTNSTFSLDAYSGTYHNPGYGSFTLCAPSSTSHYCAKVLDDFAIVDNAQSVPLPPNSTMPQLYAEWSRFWSTHVRMVHVENDTFEISLTALFPEGYGADNKPFEAYEMDAYIGQGKFVLDERKEKIVGFGLFGSDDPGMHHALGEETGIKESSIAWFEKV
ncbi:beta-lactamase/transpeptidase-like protein [Schizopora paradoxa]|uniref:Beta-lactamase/transpeptidase-like protein n=1 Tax=Schizopora paradoxa TaxID=27342 RepID=A0A0H2RPK1_9AGAM|nr:beta-lactamase/transpeptidase-like protein [Schizopora paradoxa]